MMDRLVTVVLSVTATFGLMQAGREPPKRFEQIEVDRLIVRKELIVSDTGQAWEPGFEAQQIPRGFYARSLWDGPGGLWVRSRLIKGEIDDPFDDRFHALEKDGSRRGSPGHISWNVWLDGAWRQMAIIQGEGLEYSEVPAKEWSGLTHPGRIRFQSFWPGHGEPLTDAIIAVGVQGHRTAVSRAAKAKGLAKLRWDSVNGADAYVVVRDGREVAGPLRIEGSRKEWSDKANP